MGYLKNTMAKATSWTYTGNHFALKEGFQKLLQYTSAYRLLCPWNSQARMGSHSLLQGIFPTQ